MRVAVVAHRKKTLGGGLDELRAALARGGVADPLWYEIGRSAQAPKRVRKCLKRGAELLLVWGGDGTVRACLGALVEAGAGRDVALAIVPAGTANLLATNLGIPRDVAAAVDVALHGARRPLDVGVMNREHFAVMAGTGFDAAMIREADDHLKQRLGGAAYLWSGFKNLRRHGTRTRVTVDGERWFAGRASCVLVGNVGTLLGGVQAFADADPHDGLLDIGVVCADGVWQWLRVLARTAAGAPEKSPLVSMTRGRRIDIRLRRKQPYQVDGGDRPPTDRLKVRVKRHASVVCVPPSSEDADAARRRADA